MNGKHYNAFISYRHAEKDSKIAAEIQRQLERCHIPRAIKKRFGIKKIARIFRDKEELPITSNLNDNISNALENSDFLIVICSTSTKESLWVPREIEYFLRNHTKKEVLTVLVDGEPKDVIPPMLLGERVIKTDENGNMFYEDIPIEPLSCDYRMPIKKARKEELPRLAATIIGCTYDELVRRQRQYKLKRFTSIMTTALVLAGIAIGYLVWSTIQIQQNYDESLKSQSRYIAKESLNVLENEQRIKAIQLALAALPTEDDPDRPYTPEAEYALSRSIYAYTPLLSSNIASIWNYRCTNTVQDFKVSPDGSTVSAYDSAQTLFIWDTKTREEITKINFSTRPYDIEYYDNDTLLVTASDRLMAINPKNGEIYWSNEDNEYSATKIRLINDRILAIDYFDTLYEISVSDGSVIAQHKLPQFDDGSYVDISTLCAFNDGKENKVFMSVSSPEGSFLYQICVMSLDTDEYYISDEIYNYIEDVHIIDGSTVAFVENDDLDNLSSYSYYEMKTLSASSINVICMDLNSLQIIWKNTVDYTQVAWNCELIPFQYIDPDQVSHDTIVAYVGNIAKIYSIKDGRELNSFDVNVPLISVLDNGDGTLQFITNDGYSGYSSKTTVSSASLIKHFTTDIDKAVLNNGGYIHVRGSSEIILYSSYIYDNNLGIIGDEPLGTVTDQLLGEEYFTMITHDDDGLSTLLIYSLADKTTAYKMTLNQDVTYYEYKIACEEEGKITVIGSYDEEDIFYSTLYMLTVDVKNQTYTEDTIEHSNLDDVDELTYNNGKLYLPYNDYTENKQYLEIVDMSNAQADFIEIGEYYGYAPQSPTISTNGKYAVLCSEDIDTDYAAIKYVDIENRTYKLLFTDVEPYSSVYIDEEEKYIAIATNTNVYLYSTTGDLLWEINNNGLNAYNVYIDNGELYVIYSGGVLNRYDLQDGTFLSQTDIMINSSTLYSKPSWYMDKDAHLLYTTYGKITSIIDTDSWIMTSYVTNSYGYNPANDIFVTTTYKPESYGDYYVAYFKHYTLQDMIERANTITQNTTLTEEERSFYGLSKH